MNTILVSHRIQYQILAVFSVILVAGLLSIHAIINAGHDVSNNVTLLVEKHLPQLDIAHSFQNQVNELELVLYRYYELTDTELYLKEWTLHSQKISDLLLPLDNQLIDDSRFYLQKLNTIASEFDTAMRASDKDWNLLRQHLAEFRQICAQFDDFLKVKMDVLHQSVTRHSDNTQVTISKMVLFQIVFSGVILILLTILAVVLKKQLRQAYVHQELALFPEQNPHPILKFNKESKPIYLNPAAVRLADSLNCLQEPSRLLPINYKQVSKQFMDTSSCYATKDYPLGSRLFSASFHHIEGVDAFYVYLIDVTERANAEKTLLHRANHDLLTDLPNRRRLEETLSQKTQGSLKSFSLLSITAGRLYLINASLGHEISDNLLVAMSKKLEQFVVNQSERELSLFSFETGSWFIIFNNNATPELAMQLGDELITLFSSSVCLEDRELNLPCTVGVTLYPQGGTSTRELLKNADAALRQAFREGVGIRLYSEDLTQQATRWLELEQGIKQALNNHEFTLNIQAKVDAENGNFVGGEVLIRWQHEGAWISPAEFIPVAEESGLTIAIGEWVLVTACQQWVSWKNAGLAPKRIAVNISALQFIQADFVDFVANTLISTGMPASELELEITEQVASEKPMNVIRTMNRLKVLGVRLAIDDFGTGYSSLSYLRRFPIDTLKIDQSFVSKMEDNENDAAIVRMIMSLAKELKLEVVAEGVETKEQYQILTKLGCDLIQGFYFYRPMDLTSYQILLSEQVQ